MKEKIDKMHARDEWSFEDINFEYQNLNYYLTNLDVLHLTEGMHINPLECQDLSFDHRHFLFHNLKCSNNVYNSILNKRNLIYEGLKNIYIELTMSQAKIFIEKWYYDVPNFDHLDNHSCQNLNEKDIKIIKQIQLNSKSMTQKLYQINESIQRLFTFGELNDLPWKSSHWLKSFDQDFKSISISLQKLAEQSNEERNNEDASQSQIEETEPDLNCNSNIETSQKLCDQNKQTAIDETLIIEGFGKIEEKKTQDVRPPPEKADPKDMASIMFKLRRELNKKLEETRQINDKEHVITKYM